MKKHPMHIMEIFAVHLIQKWRNHPLNPSTGSPCLCPIIVILVIIASKAQAPTIVTNLMSMKGAKRYKIGRWILWRSFLLNELYYSSPSLISAFLLWRSFTPLNPYSSRMKQMTQLIRKYLLVKNPMIADPMSSIIISKIFWILIIWI